MKFVADLHLHSKYSRAVSQDMVLAKMAQWARMKGIDVLATGDFTHPFWFEQLKNELEDAGNGLYKLRHSSLAVSHSNGEKQMVDSEIYFLLSCEISSIYSQGGKGRRIHNLFFFPTLASVEKFNGKLLSRGVNLRSDGRPIVGISSRELAKIALDVSDKALIIPAHAWTPWFSIFGSFSGFDSISECFGDMAPYIYGIETGLSSDPAMNWQVGDLDNRAILSFSDAHSLEKMGREATVFEADEVSYDSIYDAIRTSGNQVVSLSGNNKPDNPSTRIPDNLRSKIAFTIEFYPEEGKYHFTGHRDCGVSQSPLETAKNGDRCSVCGRQLTVGVMHRVEELKIRKVNFETRNVNGVRWVYGEQNRRPPYVALVPLGEIIAEAFGTAVKTKGVIEQYKLLVSHFDSEFAILLKAQVDDLKRVAHPKVVEGISRVRSGDIKIEPGYDGKFGVVKIWKDQESAAAKAIENDEAQLNLFA